MEYGREWIQTYFLKAKTNEEKIIFYAINDHYKCVDLSFGF